MRTRDSEVPPKNAGRTRARGGVFAFQARPTFIMVLDSNERPGEASWRASARLDRCGPGPVQHDGSTFPVERKPGDTVCARVEAQHVNGARDDAFIVQLART